jgi:hypothetical protein
MKKIIILFFILSANLVYGQGHPYFIAGNHYIYLDSFGGHYDTNGQDYMFTVLRSLDKAELRLVRNGIYAKHGYRFNSPDLLKYFSQYDWYKGTKTNVDSELTEDEKIVITFIRQMEANYPSQAHEELVGLWWFDLPDEDWWTLDIYDFYWFWGTKLRFYSSGFFYYMAKDFTQYYGLWSLEENKFKLSFYFYAKKDEDNYSVFNPNKHHNKYTANFEENIIFFNKIRHKDYTDWEEFMWECNFQKNEHSWKKVYPYPGFIAGDPP